MYHLCPLSNSIKDLTTVKSLAVSISVLATALGSLTSASYSTFCELTRACMELITEPLFPISDGRRPVYLFSLPFLCIGSIGVARSNAVPELLFWRFMQAFGASCGWSLGASVIGDLYKVEERGTAMGVFYSMAMLGPALSPLCGGEFRTTSQLRIISFNRTRVGVTVCVVETHAVLSRHLRSNSLLGRLLLPSGDNAPRNTGCRQSQLNRIIAEIILDQPFREFDTATQSESIASGKHFISFHGLPPY